MGSVVAPAFTGATVAPYAERVIVGVEPADHALVAAVRSGDDRAFEQLFERYQRRIAAYVFGMVGDHGRAEDITQEIFISALRRMRETERPIAFKPWVYEIAKNACIDQFRRSRRTEEISYDAEEGLGAADYGRLTQGGLSPDAAVDQKQALHDLCGAFGGLSETHHQILVLRELEGLSYREIGERLGMSRPSVESTLFRARRRLSEEYDELASGQRCLRVQALIGTAAEGLLGARDGRRLARHLSHCQACRKQAHTAGVDAAAMARRPGRRDAIGSRIAGLLPFPAFLQRRRGGHPDSVLAGGSTHGQAVMTHWTAMGTMAEPVVAGWSKAAAAAATLVLAGVGVGAGVNSRIQADSQAGTDAKRSAPARARANRPAAASVTGSYARRATRDSRTGGDAAPAPSRRPSPASSAPGSTSQGAPSDQVPQKAPAGGLLPSAPPPPTQPPSPPTAPTPPSPPTGQPNTSVQAPATVPVPGPSSADPKTTVEKSAADAAGQAGKTVAELQKALGRG